MTRAHLTVAICTIACAVGVACISPNTRSAVDGRGARAEEAAERVAVDHLVTESIATVTRDLTTPAMEGRATGSAGGERAARYIAQRMVTLGLRPAAGDDFLQPYDVYETAIDSTATVLRAGSVTLHVGDDFVPARDGPPPPARIVGPLLFVGYGVRDPQSGHDDLAGVDVRGKIVMLLIGPRLDSAAVRVSPWAREIGTNAVRATLAQAGAAGLLLVNQWPASRTYEEMARGSGISTLSRDSSAPPAALPVVILSESAADRLLALAVTSLGQLSAAAARGISTTQLIADSASLQLQLRRQRHRAYNVAGMLTGTDSAGSGEAVLLMAHFDAFGRDAAGAVRAGAADNALGTAMMLGIARALTVAHAAPRRSLIFLSTSGEERGMLGASFWADHPSRPLSKLSAVINFDGIGTEVFGPVRRVVGFGAELSDLGTTLAGVERTLGVIAEPDPFGAQRPFVRSDHIIFARRGVPALMLLGLPADSVAVSMRRAMAWVGTSYHAPGDTIRADWSWQGPRDLAAVAMLTALRVANAAHRAAWYPTSEFQRPATTASRP
jgi:hypothetical protein